MPAPADPTTRRIVRAVSALALLGIAGVVTVLAWHRPDDLAWTPQCSWRLLTGLRCPGCGMTRALHLLLVGDLVAALQLNPLALLLPPGLLAAVSYLGAALLRGRFPRLPELPRPVGWAIAGVLIGMLLYRTVIDLVHKLG